MPAVRLFLAVLLICSTAFAVDWKADLLEDAVVIQGGKMILEEYLLIKGVDEAGAETSIQMKIYSEAPASGVISRDNFVALTMTLYLPMILEMGEFEEIDAPIGTPDYEYTFHMSAGGIQIVLKDNNQNAILVRETMTWEQMFAK